MILSPFRNPPYRSPTPQTPASPSLPPAGPSPKRKRSDSADRLPSEPLRVETNLREELEDPASGCDSPRSKVAEKFRDLEIDRDGGRKRLKRGSHLRAPSPSPSTESLGERVIAQTPEPRRLGGAGPVKEDIEIQETPQLPLRDPLSSSPSAPEDALTNFRSAFRASEATDTPININRSPESTPLPPSPKVMVSPPPSGLIPDRALSPLQLNDDLSLDQAALTWQDSEITGHEIDSLLGDDGLGINGIGFRPTPAMAYARSQKRKQQVNAWKAREAKEARQRRMDRRRGGSTGEENADGEGVRRMVRFEDAG